MTFESRYQDLYNYCRTIVSNNKLTIDPSDLLNDSYILFIESKEDFNFIRFTKLILKVAYSELEIKTGSDQIPSTIGDKQCKKCHEIKSVGLFAIQKKKNGIISVRNICKICFQEQKNELRRKWVKRLRDTGGYTYNKDYQREVQRKLIKQLSDCYIVNSVLKKGGKEITEKNIIATRNRILAKRRKKIIAQ